jgi:hypothetical protein
MASRAELVRVGLEELGEDGAVSPGSYEVRMVKAIAAMIAKSRETKRARVDESKLAVPPRTLFEAVRREAGDKVLCEPIDARWFGRLGGALKALPSFGGADVALLVDWLNAGGQASWPRGVPSFGDLITHLPKWVAWAREWDRRGRQLLRGSTAVGAAVNEGSDHGLSGFATPKLL